jgi:hypothetical protein
MEFVGRLTGQHPFWVRHSDTIEDLERRIRIAFEVTEAIMFTLPPNGPVLNRPGRIGDRVLPGTNVACAHLTRSISMGVHFLLPPYISRAHNPPTTVPTHDVGGHRLSLGDRLRFGQQPTTMCRSVVLIKSTQSTPLLPALTNVPLRTVPQPGKIAPATTIPPDDVYHPSSQPIIHRASR